MNLKFLDIGFELKSGLVLVVMLLLALMLGSGRLSFEEASARADSDRRYFDHQQSLRLEAKQARFSEQAAPVCLESSGVSPDNFALVLEVGTNGRVSRSWRGSDSPFITCFQRLINEHFEFRGMEHSFYFVYEFNHVP